MTCSRRMKHPIFVAGYDWSGMHAWEDGPFSIDDAYQHIIKRFTTTKDVFDIAKWKGKSLRVLDEFGHRLDLALVIEDLKDIEFEREKARRQRALERRGLTEKQGYCFRGGPVPSSRLARHLWWNGVRSRKVGSSLRSAFEPGDLDEKIVIRGSRRSKMIFKLVRRRWDDDYPDRFPQRSWKCHRNKQWRP